MITTLNEIEQQCKRLDAARMDLEDVVTLLNDELEAAKRRRIKSIRARVAAVAQEHAALSSMLEHSADLFARPKTQIFHRIKVGFRKGVGGVSFDDEAQVIKLIRKHFPDQEEILIKVEETVRKKPLEALDVSDLKKIGCTVEGTRDVPVIKPIDGEVDKLVKSLLKDAADDAQSA